MSIQTHSSVEWVEDLIASVFHGDEWEHVAEFHGVFWSLVGKFVQEDSIFASVDETVLVDIHVRDHLWQVFVAGFLRLNGLSEQHSHFIDVCWRNGIQVAVGWVVVHEEFVQEPPSTSSDSGEEGV